LSEDDDGFLDLDLDLLKLLVLLLLPLLLGAAPGLLAWLDQVFLGGELLMDFRLEGDMDFNRVDPTDLLLLLEVELYLLGDDLAL